MRIWGAKPPPSHIYSLFRCLSVVISYSRNGLRYWGGWPLLFKLKYSWAKISQTKSKVNQTWAKSKPDLGQKKADSGQNKLDLGKSTPDLSTNEPDLSQKYTRLVAAPRVLTKNITFAKENHWKSKKNMNPSWVHTCPLLQR